MAWFCAHIVIGFVTQSSSEVIAWENIKIFEADSADDALSAARLDGEEEANLDDKLVIDGQPAQRIFAGVRKLVSINNPDQDCENESPQNGCEISFSEFLLDDIEKLMALGRGDDVNLMYTRK